MDVCVCVHFSRQLCPSPLSQAGKSGRRICGKGGSRARVLKKSVKTNSKRRSAKTVAGVAGPRKTAVYVEDSAGSRGEPIGLHATVCAAKIVKF